MRKNKCREFRQSKGGIYYTDISNQGTVLTLATVMENKSNYSDRDCNRTLAASKLQETMGKISTTDLLYYRTAQSLVMT